MVTREINRLLTSFTRTVRPRMHFASLSNLKSEVWPLLIYSHIAFKLLKHLRKFAAHSTWYVSPDLQTIHKLDFVLLLNYSFDGIYLYFFAIIIISKIMYTFENYGGGDRSERFSTIWTIINRMYYFFIPSPKKKQQFYDFKTL